MKYNLELIEWDDHHSFTRGNWQDLEDIESSMKRPFNVVSVGYALDENDKTVVLAPHVHESEDQHSSTGHMFILKSTIQSRKVLKKAK